MLHRRQLLQTAGLMSLAAWGAPQQGLAEAEVVPHRRAPKFKLSLAAYSYREALSGSKATPATMDLHGFIDECAAMQLEGTELTGYYMPEEPTKEYLHGLRRHCFEAGLSVSGTAIRCDFGWPEGSPQRQENLAHVRKWIDHAAELFAPTIRIFAGHPKKGMEADAAHQLMVTGMREACKYAGERGIILGLENHGGPTETAQGVLKLLHDVDSPWLGVNLDSGNFRGDVDPYEQMAMLAPYAVNAQIKVALPMPDGQRHESDFGRIFEILRKANYRGFVVLEYEEKGDVPAECRKYVQLLRKYSGETA